MASLRAMDEAGVSHGVKQREAAPLSVKAFSGLWAQLTLALVGGACLDLPKHLFTHDPHTTNIHLQTCASWRHVNQPETLPTY